MKKFECYSKPLYGFLTMKGFRYEYTFTHKSTKRFCWVYVITDELSRALTEWTDKREK